jgi:hypothetical protein
MFSTRQSCLNACRGAAKVNIFHTKPFLQAIFSAFAGKAGSLSREGWQVAG